MLFFISGPGTSAKFIGCYEVGPSLPVRKVTLPEGFPALQKSLEDHYFFDLKLSEIMADLKERLIIDWGKSTLSWHQRATNEKVVLAIQYNLESVI